MNNLVPKYEITINGHKLKDVAPIANSSISRLTYQEAFGATSNVEIEFADAYEFDLSPSMVDTNSNPMLELKIGYHRNLEKVFEGTIVRCAPSGSQGVNPKLTIKAYDYGWHLKILGKPKIYTDTNLLSVTNEMIKKTRAGISLNPIISNAKPLREAKTDDIKSFSQTEITDWEHLSAIAKAVKSKIHCRSRDLYIVDDEWLATNMLSSKKTFIYKPLPDTIDDETTFKLLAFKPEVSRQNQRNQVEVESWNSINERGEKQGSTSLNDLTDKGYAYSEIVVKSELEETLIINTYVKDTAEAKRLAEAELRERADRLVKGDAVILGDPTIRIGDVHALKMNPFGKIGKRFSGEYRVQSVRHTFSKSGYITEFDINRDRLSEVK